MPVNKRTATGVLGGLMGLIGLSAIGGILIATAATPVIAITGLTASNAIGVFEKLPGYLDIDSLMLPTTLYAKDPKTGNDVELTRFYEQDRSPVTYDQIAPVMIDALLSSEDPRYFTHGGIDLVGTGRALLNNVTGAGKLQGASSISQQYVKNVLVQRCERDAETEEAKSACFYDAVEDSLSRKLQELKYAVSLEQRYSKEEILLGYLNIANFGGVTYGIDAAARHYYGVSAKDLTLEQATALAGTVQNPNQYRVDQPNNASNGAANGYAETKDRQAYVLTQMLNHGKITREEYDRAKAAPIEPHITYLPSGCAAAGGAEFFCQLVKGVISTDKAFGETPDDRQRTLNRGGLKIYTTLDWRIQDAANAAIHDIVPQTVDWIDLGSASVSIEASTGRILSSVQNKSFNETDNAPPGTTSLAYTGDWRFGGSTGGGFEAGSTFKLFTLVDWLEKGRSLNEVLNGRNRIFDKMKCDGRPIGGYSRPIQNSGNVAGFTGNIIDFTAQSLNSGYLAMAEQLDNCDIGRVAEKMGVKTGKGENIDMTTAFSILGSNAVSPIAMAGAYATIANKGVYCEPTLIDKVTDSNGSELPKPDRKCSQVLAPEIAATAAYALQRVMTSGTGTGGNPWDGTPLIGKTGTHENQQTWLMESSTKVTTANWVGHASGTVDMSDRQMSYRYDLASRIQEAVDAAYGGDRFPDPDPKLMRTVLRDVPNVVGSSIADATARLEGAGFQVFVGPEVDDPATPGTVVAQNPAGQAAGGAQITISPSNGKGVKVPEINAGDTLAAATTKLTQAGLAAAPACTAVPSATAAKVTGVSPAPGTTVGRGSSVTVSYQNKTCP